jgi:pimeloyl-ACP methyl ester carboxylesterase
LLHTFFGTVEQWEDYTQELSKSFKVITIDLPGHGRSDYMDTTDIYDNKKAAKYIIGLLKELRIDTAYFWGASSGGTICLEIATLKPELTKKIIVLGAQIYYSQQTRNWIEKRGQVKPDEESIKSHGLKKAEILEKQFYRYKSLYGELSLTPDILATITAKTLIINGDNDKPAPFISNALQMYQSIPNAHLWIVPNGGHLPHLDKENNADFLRRVTDFLKN